jgi:hypothetical protein
MTNESFFKKASKNRCVFKGIRHVYIIDNGCKVELYDDDSVKMYCTVGGSYFYRPLTNAEIFSMYQEGFDKASLKISIKELEKNIDQANKRKSFVKASALTQIMNNYTSRL